jgi:hypothetical protein
MGLPPRAFAVIFAVVAGQVLFGLLAGGALFAARGRASRRALVQIALIIGFVESFVIAVGLAAANAARGGSTAVTAGLLWYAGGGWTLVQLVIVYWIVWVWWKRRRAAD